MSRELTQVADTKFELCHDVERVLKIGRDFQKQDTWRGAHHDTAKLLCDTIEYLRDLQPRRNGKWENGTEYEYEYAYCSECGRMQWAGWDTHKQARENIESFADKYRYCPGCGAEMEGGVYVE